MLSDIEAKLKAGNLIEANLDPSIHNIWSLERANALGAWIAINAADAGIRSDYPHDDVDSQPLRQTDDR